MANGDENDQEQQLGRAERVGVRIGQALAVLAVVALPVLAALIAYRVWNAGAIDPKINPLNTIFASRIVVGAIRIAILVAVVYVIVSMIVWAMRGEFLTGAGPIQIGKSAKAAAEDRDNLAVELSTARQTISNLEGRLEETAEALDNTGRDLDLALEYISTLEAREEGNQGG